MAKFLYEFACVLQVSLSVLFCVCASVCVCCSCVLHVSVYAGVCAAALWCVYAHEKENYAFLYWN